MRTLVGLLLAVALLGAAVSGCSESPGTGDKGYVDGDGIITRLATDERKTPGEVAGETLQGKQVSLEDYAGKVVVLNVWGSWCSPCRTESKLLTGAAEELSSDDQVAFLGINTRDSSRDPALAFERRYEVPYPSIFDPSGRTLLAFYGTLNPSAIPSTLVLDEEGRVAASIIGEVPTQQTLVDLVKDVQGAGR